MASNTDVSQDRELQRTWVCNQCRTRIRRSSRGLGRLFAAKAPPAAARKLALPRVLVIDDQVLMLRGLARLLAGYETVIADGPAKALALLRSGMHFDAVVCDVMMPDMTGPELYVRCCQILPDVAERFVFTSADPIAARRMIDQAATRVGARRAPPLLTKPTSRDVLVLALTRVVADAAQRSGTYAIHTAGDASPSQRSASEPQPALLQRESSRGSRSGSRH